MERTHPPRSHPPPPRRSARRCWPAPAAPGTAGSPLTSGTRCPRSDGGYVRFEAATSSGCTPRAWHWIHRVDREVLATITPTHTGLGEALTALAVAALASRARLTPHVPVWTLIGRLARWRLVPARVG